MKKQINTELENTNDQEQKPFFNFSQVEVGGIQTFIVEGANKNLETGSLIVWTNEGPISFYSAKYECYTNGCLSLKKALKALNTELKTDIDAAMTLRDNVGDLLIYYQKVESTVSKTGYAHRWTLETADE